MFQPVEYIKFRDMKSPRPAIPHCHQGHYPSASWILIRKHTTLLLIKIILRSSFAMEIPHALLLGANTLSE